MSSEDKSVDMEFLFRMIECSRIDFDDGFITLNMSKSLHFTF